jgi:formate hydrogenlyase subunit 4
MNLYLSLLTQVLHIGLMLATAPSVAGATDWLAARMAGRSGPSSTLPWQDVIRLWRKTPVTQENLSIVSAIAPAAGLGMMLAAAALVPSFTLGMALSPLADLLVIAALLAAGRIIFALAAFDSGAALPGLAAQDAASLAVLAESALILLVVALGVMGAGFGLDPIITQQQEGMLAPAASSVALTALLAIVLAETASGDGLKGQVFTGPDLAMAKLAGWLRRLVWIDLIGALFLPLGMSTAASGPASWLLGLLAWAAKLVLFVFCFCAVQTALGRIPRRSLPNVIGAAALLALLSMLIALVSTGAA